MTEYIYLFMLVSKLCREYFVQLYKLRYLMIKCLGTILFAKSQMIISSFADVD